MIKLARPYARLLDCATKSDGINLLKKIEWCGRISHRSEDVQSEDSYDRFIRTVVLGHGDWSIVEHASVSVDALVDRGITHEIVRHRLFSYTQESTRFVNYEKKMPPTFICPFEYTINGHGEPWPVHGEENLAMATWLAGIAECERVYKELITKCNKPPQIARSIFPNALASRIIITGNLRNWRHFFIMRTTKEAHPQMKEVTLPLLAEFKEKIPILYEDIEPEVKQTISMSKIR